MKSRNSVVTEMQQSKARQIHQKGTQPLPARAIQSTLLDPETSVRNFQTVCIFSM